MGTMLTVVVVYLIGWLIPYETVMLCKRHKIRRRGYETMITFGEEDLPGKVLREGPNSRLRTDTLRHDNVDLRDRDTGLEKRAVTHGVHTVLHDVGYMEWSHVLHARLHKDARASVSEGDQGYGLC